MLWSLPRRRIASKRVILNYQDLMQNRAPGIIFKQLGTPVFVETDGSQARAFTHFLGRNHLPFVFFCSLTNCWHFKIQNYCSAWYWVFSSNLCTWFGPKIMIKAASSLKITIFRHLTIDDWFANIDFIDHKLPPKSIL